MTGVQTCALPISDRPDHLRAPKRLEALGRFAVRNRLSLVHADRHHPNFERELARSSAVLTQHGYGVFDALALGTLPIVWSRSESEAVEIEASAESLGLPALYVRRESDLFLLHAALAGSIDLEPSLRDGSHELIGMLAESVGLERQEHAA